MMFHPPRPIVTRDHVERAVKRARMHPKDTPAHNEAWRKADKISDEYCVQNSVYKYGSDIAELVELLTELEQVQ